MADRKQTFTPEFRAEAVRLAQTGGRSRRAVVADLGVGLHSRIRPNTALPRVLPLEQPIWPVRFGYVCKRLTGVSVSELKPSPCIDQDLCTDLWPFNMKCLLLTRLLAPRASTPVSRPGRLVPRLRPARRARRRFAASR